MSNLCRKDFLSSFSLMLFVRIFGYFSSLNSKSNNQNRASVSYWPENFFFVASDQKPMKSTPGSANVSPRMGFPVFLRGF